MTQSQTFWKIMAVGFLSLFAISMAFNFFDIDVTPKWEAQIGKQKLETISQNTPQSDIDQGLTRTVLPEEGFTLPITWNDFGKQLMDSGVIDREEFENLYAQRGGLDSEAIRLLEGSENGNITINQGNSGILLNLLWAFGLGNKNIILEEGPMQDPEFGGADRFASTGGWTLAKGDVMDHYSAHQFVSLTKDQQEMVTRVAENIFRPCCGNSTFFPDCNHGMAMLGLLQIMAAQGVTEEQMYETALQVNSFWFPDTYLTLAKYFQDQGTSWEDTEAKEVLGATYSSAEGYRQILAQVEPVQSSGGGGCGV